MSLLTGWRSIPCDLLHKITPYSFFLVVSVLVLSGVKVASAQNQNDIRTLEPGKPVERKIAARQIHSYQIMLAAGQYLRLVLSKHGVDPLLILTGPDGNRIAAIEVPNGTQGGVPVLLVTDRPDTYKIDVDASKTTLEGDYELKIQELREATEQDRRRFAAQNTYMEAVKLAASRTGDSWERAIQKYEEAAQLYRGAGDRQREAYTLTETGDFLFKSLGNKEKALDHYFRALKLDAEVNDASWRAYTLNNIGQVYGSLGDKQDLDYYQKALPLWDASGDRDGKAITLYNIGWAYNERGKKLDAINIFKQALDIRRAMSDSDGQATLLSAIGAIYNSLGERLLALERFKEAAPIFHALNDHQGEASSITFIGTIYFSLGENRRALDFFNQALEVRRAGNDKRGEGITLTRIAQTYSSLGEIQQALDYYNQALEVFKSVEDNQFQADILNTMGVFYSSLGDYQKAIGYFDDALEYARKAKRDLIEAYIFNNKGRAYFNLGDQQKALGFFNDALRLFTNLDDRMGKASVFNNLGKLYFNLNDKRKATDLYHQALEAIRGTGNPREEASVLTNIGAVYSSTGEWQTAIDFYNRAMELNRSTSYKRGEANTLYHLARAERDRGNLIEARRRIETAMEIIESLRTKVVGQDLRASYFASVQDHYEFYIDLLTRSHKQQPLEGFEAAALQTSERARARSLLELLIEARADIRRGVDATLLERELRLRESLNAKADRQMQLLSAKHTQQQAEAVAKDIEKLTTAYQEVKGQIRAKSPGYAALTQPQPLSLSEIQQQVLDPDTMLLEYSLGEERSYLWAVTQSSIASFTLPKRAEVEAAARRVYELLTARNRSEKGETIQQRRARLTKAEAQYPEAAAALSRMVLSPVASMLMKKRLLIVCEGALQYVPFAALPAPVAARQSTAASERISGDSQNRQPATAYLPLIVDHEIVSLPSASALAVLRREIAGRRPADRAVAVLADPVFDKYDKRAGGATTESAALANSSQQVNDVRQVIIDAGLADDGGRITRLPFSRREAKAIVSVAPPGESFMALDFKASRATATSAELRQFRIVHFATHGVLDSQHPELSGVILSLVDERGAPQDGFLRLHDIYNLDLPAELVVLSACQTGLGKAIRGEGLVGLTRGFMYAGAARVVASLWQVDDVATAELMSHFYRAMLRERLRPAAALRAAQVEMWRQRRWHAPYHWAAFVLQGEWK